MKRILFSSMAAVGSLTLAAGCGDPTVVSIGEFEDIDIPDTATLPDGTVGADYSAEIEYTGGSERGVRWQIVTTGEGSSAFPAGLFVTSQLNPLRISGRPRVAGDFTFTLRVADSSGTQDQQDFTISIADDPNAISITAEGLQDWPTDLPEGRPDDTWIVGDTVNATFTAAGGAGTGFVFGATNVDALPPGTRLSTDGVLSGSFTRPGTYSFTVQASDPNGEFSQETYVITVQSFIPSFMWLTANCPDGKVDDVYECDLELDGGVAPFNIEIAPPVTSVPPGLELVYDGESNTAQLRGVPTETGAFAFAMIGEDDARQRARRSFFVDIFPADPPLRISGRIIQTDPGPEVESFLFPQLEASRSYTFEIVAVGGTEEGYMWTVCGGALPDGMMLTNGTPNATFMGAPSRLGIFDFELCLQDSDEDQTARRSFQATVGPAIQPVSIASVPGPLPTSSCGVMYEAEIEGTGGVPPYGWAVQPELPSGLSALRGGNPSTFISGVPTSSGAFTFDVTVYDSRNQTSAAQFTLDVAGPCPLP